MHNHRYPALNKAQRAKAKVCFVFVITGLVLTRIDSSAQVTNPNPAIQLCTHVVSRLLDTERGLVKAEMERRINKARLKLTDATKPCSVSEGYLAMVRYILSGKLRLAEGTMPKYIIQQMSKQAPVLEHDFTGNEKNVKLFQAKFLEALSTV